ncbi:hypothetical protein P9112_004580 [Eukaryota sp. TZLM1-RC]
MVSISSSSSNVAPSSKPVNGKIWTRDRVDKPNRVKFRAKPLKTTWEQKQQLKQQRAEMLAKARAIKEEKEAAKQLAREQRKEKERRKQEQDAKPQSYQVITNTQKLKKIKKKHLRQFTTGL